MRHRACAAAPGLFLLSFLVGCLEHRTSEPQPQVMEVGSESHFLRSCKRDSECGDLRCMDDTCTKACNTDDVCEALSAASICQHDPNQSGGSCDVECEQDSDCKSLGKSHECKSGHCRSDMVETTPDAGAPASNVDADAASAAPVDAGPELMQDAAHDAAAPDTLDCADNPNQKDQVCVQICPERCDDIDNDCDRKIDEGPAADDCDMPNAAAACVLGECMIDSCNAGYADCDADRANGCETALNTLANCGSCDNACTKASCATGTCMD